MGDITPAEARMLKRLAAGEVVRVRQSATCKSLELRGYIVTFRFPEPPQVTPAGQAILKEISNG